VPLFDRFQVDLACFYEFAVCALDLFALYGSRFSGAQSQQDLAFVDGDDLERAAPSQRAKGLPVQLLNFAPAVHRASPVRCVTDSA